MSVVRLVDLSVERDTPVLLLDALRRIAPNVELVHIGENRWWLGLVRPNPSQHMATLPLGNDALMSTPRAKRLLLQRQGFRLLGEYTDEQLSESYLCDELHHMLNRTEREVERDFNALVDKSDYGANMEAQLAGALRERFGSERRSIWAKGARARVQLGYTGMPAPRPTSSLLHLPS